MSNRRHSNNKIQRQIDQHREKKEEAYLDIAVAYSNRSALCSSPPFSSTRITSTTSAVESSMSGKSVFLERHATTYPQIPSASTPHFCPDMTKTGYTTHLIHGPRPRIALTPPVQISTQLHQLAMVAPRRDSEARLRSLVHNSSAAGLLGG
jgi:hypothetical protein